MLQIGVVGVNHKTAPLHVREIFQKNCTKCLLNQARFPVVVLSTCNRTEVYFCLNEISLTQMTQYIVEPALMPFIYSYQEEACFIHLCQVSLGLDSALIGETEIQGQVRKAYELAAQAHRLSHHLHYAFQKGLKISKELRSSSNLYHQTFSVETLLLQQIKDTLCNWFNAKILFIGASEINIKILNYFRMKSVGELAITNRNNDKIKSLESSCDLVLWQDVKTWVNYDVVIVATKALSPVILLSDIQYSYHTQLLIDLSVPRNIDPQLGAMMGIELLDMDSITEIASHCHMVKKEEKEALGQKVRLNALKHAQIFMQKTERAALFCG